MLGSPFFYSAWPYELSYPKLAHMHQLLESSPHRQPHIVSQQSKLISHPAPRHVLRKLPLPQPTQHPLAHTAPELQLGTLRALMACRRQLSKPPAPAA